MNVPEVSRCFGMFPPKYATYLIALFGLSSGGIGLTGIILYGLVEKALVKFLTGGRDNIQVDDSIKKMVLLTIGLTSLLLLVANAFLFLGATARSRGALTAGVWVIFAMCLIIIAIAIGAPLSCFFFEMACIVKKISTHMMVLSAFAVTIFLEFWLYFMVVANNYLNEVN